jgi:hypothetical protein
MPRITPLGWIIIIALVGAVVVWPLSEGLSLAMAIAGGVFAFGAVAEALGNDAAPRDRWASHKRIALRRLSAGRDWDRKAPDHADEPADLIWARERERRGLR